MTIPGPWSEARARCDAATEGPWEHVAPAEDGTIHRVVQSDADFPFSLLRMDDTGYTERSSWDQRAADATFIAAARSDLPAALDAIDAVLALHPVEHDEYGWHCPACNFDLTDENDQCPTRAAALGVTE